MKKSIWGNNMGTNWEALIDEKNLSKEAKRRKYPYIEKKTWASAQKDEEELGFSYVSTYKGGKYILMHKDKKFDRYFEDTVWSIFYKLGFYVMNGPNNFIIQWGPGSKDTQQIDVFAIDDETAIVVECKAAENYKEGFTTFKKNIEALIAQKDGIQKEIHSRYPNRKVKFIWATHNINLDRNDLKRLLDNNIAYFDDEAINYYSSLVDYLGTAARYQMLGDLFRKTKIKNMDTKVPAIRGKMGGFEYYSFSIKPSLLLKIGYVLHQSYASEENAENYQRLIKRNRLLQIRKFINEGGYFPNSIIISIDTNGRGLDFQPVTCAANSELSTVGTLTLPQAYHSAYIIDGQHRLYGYSESEYADKNAIPVVAFKDLPTMDQMKLFMDINENQKAVPKNIRNMLNSDLLWDSNSLEDQREAVRARVGRRLGEMRTSALYQRILLKEGDTQTVTRCITLEQLQLAIKRSDYLSSFDKKNKLTRSGLFDNGNLQDTFERLLDFLNDMIIYISEKAQKEWSLGDEGLLSINRSMYAYILLLNDILLTLSRGKKPEIDSLRDPLQDIEYAVIPYLDALVTYLNNLTPVVRNDMKQYVGSSGYIKFWRTFQKIVRDSNDDFNPEGLDQYLEDESKQYNDTSRIYIVEIERQLKKIVKTSLINKYGDDLWMMKGLPKKIYGKAKTQADKKNYDIVNNDEKGEQVSAWDYVSLDDVQKIVTQMNWSEIFEPILAFPGVKGDKSAKTKWISNIAGVKNRLNGLRGALYSVKKSEYEEIDQVYNWLCKG